jgi:hypothetical protein
MEIFRLAKKFGSDDVNRDCSFVLDEMYKLMFYDIPVCKEFNYCNRCKKFEVWNLMTIYPSNLVDMQTELESFQFKCPCGSAVNKVFCDVLVVAPKHIDLNGVEQGLDARVDKIPLSFKILGKIYYVKAIVDMKGNHYTALCLNPATQRFHSFDCLKKKSTLVPVSFKIKIALLILTN